MSDTSAPETTSTQDNTPDHDPMDTTTHDKHTATPATPTTTTTTTAPSVVTTTTASRQPLPFPIHPDDAKDKVFTAILKALARVDNKPSSPKELANTIIKYKYATLGGATPYATVSSRISQHFKRAAEHNPPRPPLLAKHIDTVYPRRTQYSVVDVGVPASESSEPVPPATPRGRGRGRRGSRPGLASEPVRRVDHKSVVAQAQAQAHLTSDMSGLSSEDEGREVGEEGVVEKLGTGQASVTSAVAAAEGSTAVAGTAPKMRTLTKKRKRTHVVPRGTPNRVRSRHVTEGKRRRMEGEGGQDESEVSGSDLEADDESYMDDEETDTDEEIGKDAGHPEARRAITVTSPVATAPSLIVTIPKPVVAVSTPTPAPIVASTVPSSVSSPSDTAPSSSSNNGSSNSGPSNMGKQPAPFVPAPTMTTTPSPALAPPATIRIPTVIQPTHDDQSDDESEPDYSDYHEEMLKGDLNIDDDGPSPLPQHAIIPSFTPSGPFESRPPATPKVMAPPTSQAPQTTPTSTSAPSAHFSSLAPHSPRSRKTPGGTTPTPSLMDDLWLPYAFDQDFDAVFLSSEGGDGGHLGPLNIADPESISVSELDNYFPSSGSGSGNYTPPRKGPAGGSSPGRYKLSAASAAVGRERPASLQKALFGGRTGEEVVGAGAGVVDGENGGGGSGGVDDDERMDGEGVWHGLAESAFEERRVEKDERAKINVNTEAEASMDTDAVLIVKTRVIDTQPTGSSVVVVAESEFDTSSRHSNNTTYQETPIEEDMEPIYSQEEDAQPILVNLSTEEVTTAPRPRRGRRASSVASSTTEPGIITGTGMALRQRRGSASSLTTTEGITLRQRRGSTSSDLDTRPHRSGSRRTSKDDESDRPESPARRLSVSELPTAGSEGTSIRERVYGLLRVYELVSVDTDVRILRFIEATDGSSSSVAKRTRNGEFKSGRRTAYTCYLDAGNVNATQLRKAARSVMGAGKFEAVMEKEGTVINMNHGPMECRGAWVPLHRARELVNEYRIEHFAGIKQLLSDMPSKQDSSSSDASDEGSTTSDKKSTGSGDPERGQTSNDDELSAPETESEDEDDSKGGKDVEDAKHHATERAPQPAESIEANDPLKLLALVAEADAARSATIVTSQLTSSSSSAPEKQSPTPVISAPISPITLMPLLNAGTLSVLARRARMMSPSPNFEVDDDSYVKYEVEDEGFGSDDGKGQRGYVVGATSDIPNRVNATSVGVSISATAMVPAFNCPKVPSHLAISTAAANLSPVTPAPSPSTLSAPELTQLAMTDNNDVSPTLTPTMPSAPPSPMMNADAMVIGVPTAGDKQTIMIATNTPTTPSIYITVIDHIAVYVTLLTKAAGFDKDCRLMRRVDTGFVNGTTLLMAGGIETESERSIVLSLEVGRMRVRKHGSELFGTWIPLRRAMALATSCSLRHKLGPFLNENLDTYFPSPLPVSLPILQKAEAGLQAMTLAALRNSNPSSTRGPGFLAVSVSPNGANTHLQQLLLNMPHRHVKFGMSPRKAPMLGCFDDDNLAGAFRRKEISVVESSAMLSPTLAKSPPVSVCEAESPIESTPPLHDLPTPEGEVSGSGSGSGLASGSSSSPESEIDVVNNESDDNTDTDEDVEEVRERMKRIRAAAVDAMESGENVDLDDIVGGVAVGVLDDDYDVDPIDWNREGGDVVMMDGRHVVVRHHVRAAGTEDEESVLDMVQKATNEAQRRRSGGKGPGKAGAGKMGGRKVVSHHHHQQQQQQQRPVGATVAASVSGPKQGRRQQQQQQIVPAVPVVRGPAVERVQVLRGEEDEDEEIDIGGSDRDDDLR
ncbi:hypothetical protein BC938DRAFT_482567 [Jimgerdemannia flammicorona]|uniref:HTH APSES-type domain-containing protein n=1 Tax=Jimgerdemannia flammicorona TaxID=994334 RepID=A0A433QDT3_9FUNG|nr:hypothetical protein BC938DRAFT_482567 [Jimgerdemannia flammicorona]